MIPEIMGRIENYSFLEKCYILDAYHRKGILTKGMAIDLEIEISKKLWKTKECSLDELATVTNIMTKTWQCTWEF